MIADGPPSNRPPHITLEACPLLSSRSLKMVVLGCALIAGGCDRQSDAPRQPEAEASGKMPAAKLDRTQAGRPLPDVTVRDPDGEELALDSLSGSPVLVNLWATWCAPCVKELPTLQAIANRADVGVAVVTISQDIGEASAVQEFLDQRSLVQLPAWIDAQGELPAKYGAQALPMTVLYDAQGKEVWRYLGDRDWSSEESLKLLSEAVLSPQG
ncbi:MAG: TlpA family protein disulfide reductase [Novosphingobium sp.]|nr:TlpA family protein disulfide reductase [Novosphingobium sp.]